MTPRCRKNLIVLRAGDGSLHRDWLTGPVRDFDIFVSYYGLQPDLHRAEADYYEMRRGPKWSCLAELLAENAELMERYDAFWFPDDDLAGTTETINRMFALFHGFALSLAQPALTPDSYYTWKDLLQRPDYVLRYVPFVEVMAPIFTRAALQACLPTFSKSLSGWGLDYIWPSLVQRTDPGAMAVLDATPVRHTRPLGGELYLNHPEMDPHRDLASMLAQYGITASQAADMHEFKGGIARVAAPPPPPLSLPQRLWEALNSCISR